MSESELVEEKLINELRGTASACNCNPGEHKYGRLFTSAADTIERLSALQDNKGKVVISRESFETAMEAIEEIAVNMDSDLEEELIPQSLYNENRKPFSNALVEFQQIERSLKETK